MELTLFNEQRIKQSTSAHFSLTPLPETWRAIHTLFTPIQSPGWRLFPYEPEYPQKSTLKIQTLNFGQDLGSYGKRRQPGDWTTCV